MKQTKVLYNIPWDFTFFQDQELNYYLLVLCGGVTAVDVCVQLTKEEVESYKQHGIEPILELKKQINYKHSDFSHRSCDHKQFNLTGLDQKIT